MNVAHIDLKLNSSFLWRLWVLKRYGDLGLPTVTSLPVAQGRCPDSSHEVKDHAVGETGIHVERRFNPPSSWSGQGSWTERELTAASEVRERKT